MKAFPQNSLKTTSDTQKRIRVLIVDDSALMRKIISQIIGSQTDMEVVGTAPNGEEALKRVKESQPDVITLDIEMPKMNGVVFLETLMQQQPTRVVMLSSLTTAGAEITLECLRLGAVDVVAKPSGSISLDLASCGEEIAQKVRAAAGARLRLARSQTPTMSTPPPLRSSALGKTPPTIVVAIASSTGGPGAVHELLSHLPADLDAGYVIVQHLPQGFTEMFAQRLDRQSALQVREAHEGETVERGVVLVAPSGKHLFFDERNRVALNADPPLWGVRPAADIMMRSVAERFGAQTMGVVLTGMGRDGALGAKAIRTAGGVNLAQDEATSVIFGMPRAAWETGAVERLVPLSDMATQVALTITKRASEYRRPAFRVAI